MSVHTRSQKLAQAAFRAVQDRYPHSEGELSKEQKEYRTFAKKFPALIHTCGVAQALAFAEAKGHTDYLDDLASVVRAAGEAQVTSRQQLAQHGRDCHLAPYLRLSRNTLTAAGWLKRYVEAVAGEED